MEESNSTRDELAREVRNLRQRIAEYEVRLSVSRIRTKRSEQLSSLREDLLHAGTLQEKLKRITDGLVNIFDADFARIWISKPADRCSSGCVHAKVTDGEQVCRFRDRCLHLFASSGRYTHVDGQVHQRVPFGCYKIGRVASGLEPKFITNDVANDLGIHDPEWARASGLVSSAGFRLLSADGEPIGVLALFSKHALSGDDAVSLEGMANTAAQTLQTAIVEDALRLSEERLKGILGASPVGIVITQDREIKWVNDAWLKMFGFEDEHECLGQGTRILYPSDEEYARVGAKLFSGPETGVVTETDAKFRRKDGGVFDGNIRVKVLDPSASAGGTIAAISDVTIRRRSEEALRVETERFKMLSERAPFGIVIIAKDGTFEYVNLKFTEIFGYDRNDVPNGTLFYQKAYPDPAYRHEVKSAWKKDLEGLASKETGSGIFEATCKDGYNKIVHFRSAKLGTGEYLMTCEDITDRIRAEEALHDSEEKLKAVVYGCPNPQLVIDRDHRVIFWNKAIEELTGVRAEEVVGTDHHWKAFYDEQRPCMVDLLVDGQVEQLPNWYGSKYSKSKLIPDAYRGTDFFPMGSHEGKWLEFTAALIRDSTGNVVGAIETTEDITLAKRAEEALREAHAELERRVAERTAELASFSYSVSHDLRAPLRGIDGWSLALLEDCSDQLNEQGRKYLEYVRTETQRMGRLIDDLLGLSRVTCADIIREPVDLSQLAHSIARRLRESDPGRQAEFIIQPGLTSYGDARLLEVLLTNLMDNAWKFTCKHPSAKIEFGRTEGQGRSAYFMRDDGAGFDMNYAGKLFGAFQRMHQTSEFPGSGVGLATVRRIVHRHGGQVWGEAEVEKGATFYFTL